MDLINKLLQAVPFALRERPWDVVAATVVDTHAFVGHLDGQSRMDASDLIRAW